MLRYISLLLVLSGILFFSCAGGGIDPDAPNDPQEAESRDLREILRKAEGMPFLRSLIVVRDGKILIEKYMNGGRADRFIDLRSASKSVLSAVAGIALAQGYIESLDQKVMDFFPEYAADAADDRVFDLTVRHLMSMTSGFDVEESKKDYRGLYASADWIRHILTLPFKTDPGKRFAYQSFNTHLLSAVIARATGEGTFEYAQRVLFQPLGIEKVIWEKDPKGYSIGGWGMSLTARDMAKLGMLYVAGGRFNGKQVLPAEWIRESTTEKTGMIGTYYSGWNKSYGYGCLWWIRRKGGYGDIPFASGHGGQRIVLMTEENAVIVVQADPGVDASASHRNHRSVDSLLFDDVADYLIK